MTDKPTPKEIDDLVYELRQAGKDDTYSFASAVLAKWGQPAHSGEPVATVQTIHGVTVGYLETAVPVGTKLYAAPQPVGRGPLTPEQIDSAYRKVWSTVPHAQRLSAFALEIETEVRKSY